MADGTVIIDTDLDSSGIEKGMKKVTSTAKSQAASLAAEYRKQGMSASEAMTKAWQEVGRDSENYEININSLGSLATKGIKAISTLALSAGTAITGILGAATTVGMGFESSMSQVAATMGITVDEIENGSGAFELLEAAAKNAGKTTKFSASQSAEALNYLALAGYEAEEAVQALPTVLDLAAAGGLELSYASDLVTDSMAALGLEMNDLGKFTDQLAKTSQKSNTSVSQLGEAILTVGGTAKTLAGGTTELNTALGILADNGVKGAEGGTALRNIILSLSAPTDTAAKKMKELGLEVFDAEGNMKPLNETFEDLNGVLSSMTQGEQTQVLNEIFNKTDLKSVNALLANSGDRFDELSGYIDDASGAAANMAETMENNLKGKLTIIGSSLEGVGLQVYEKLEEPLKKAAETAIGSIGSLSESLTNGPLANSVDQLAEGFGSLIENIAEGVEIWLPKILDAFTWLMDNSGTIAALVTGIGAAMLTMNVANMILGVVKAFNTAKKAKEGLTVAQWLYNTAVAANPIGLVIALIVGLVAGLVVLWNTNEDFRNAIIGAWNAILDTGKAVWEWLVKFFTEDIPNAFNAVIDFVKNNWQGLLLLIVNPFAGAFKLLYDNCEGFRNFINELWDKILNKIKEWGSNVYKFFTETIPKWIDDIGAWFNELPYKIGYAIGEALGAIIKWGIDTWNYLTENVPKWIENVGTWFSELPGKIQQWLTDALNRAIQWGSDMAKKATESAQKFINNIIEWFKKLPGRISEWFTETIKKAQEFVNNLGNKAKEAGKDFVDKLTNAVKDLPNQMMQIGKNIVEGIWNGITSMGSWIMDKVGGFFGGIVDGAKKALGIHSPSRVFRDEVGKYMAQGVGVGFEGESSNVEKDMQSSIEGITAKMKATIIAEQSGGIPSSVGKVNNDVAKSNQSDRRPQARQNITIEVPVIVDGREMARATAPYVDEFEAYQEGR